MKYPQHPYSSMFPPLSDDEFEALKIDIRDHSQYLPIYLYENMVLDGWHRYKILLELGTEPEFVDFVGSDEEAMSFVLGLNVHRRHITVENKAKIVTEVLKKFPSLSNRTLAKMTKTSHPFVGEVREELEEQGQLEAVTSSLGADGKSRPAKRRKSPEREAQLARNKSSAQSVEDAIPVWRSPSDVWKKMVTGLGNNKEAALELVGRLQEIGEAEVAVDSRMKAVDDEQPVLRVVK